LTNLEKSFQGQNPPAYFARDIRDEENKFCVIGTLTPSSAFLVTDVEAR
jgi:hypothetical protein